MKKALLLITSLILVLAICAGLAGCGSDNKSDAEKKTDTASSANESATAGLTANDVVFTYNNVSVELNSKADDVIAALGEPLDVSSQLSCHANEGDDKTYTYDGFIVNTYPLDGEDRILEVVIKGEGIPTSKGIKVGDAVSAVTDAYGSDYNEVGMYYAYDAGDSKSLQFFIQNDKVQEISYYYDV